MRKRSSQYQYEPLVTPEKWTGEERGFAVRLTQILDDLHAKFSRQKETARAEKTEMENSISRTNEELSALSQTVSSLKKEIVNSSFPVGSCYTTTTNNNPANILGIGTWTLIDKMFSYKNVNTGFFTYNTTNASAAGDFRLIREGHGMRIRFSVTPINAVEDTTIELGTMNIAELGISSNTTTLDFLGVADGGNGIAMMNMNHVGVVKVNDCVTKTSGGTLVAGQKIYCDIVIRPARAGMLDSACDQFIWKRTA